MVEKHTGLFRVRRGWFGRSVLQEMMDYPTYVGGFADASIRDYVWEDVLYKNAPRALVSQFCDDVVNKFTDGRRSKP